METFISDEESALDTTVQEQPDVQAVIGLDVGGTSTRAGILTQGGNVVALATGPGANLHSSPGAASATLTNVLVRAKEDALRALGHTVHLSACVAGVAGGGLAGQERVQSMLTAALARAGLAPTVVELMPDPVVAFAAGSPTADGLVLLAGTGAAAFGVEAFHQTSRSDGLGWLLGDVGGGIWLGLEGFRAAAADLDGRGPSTALTQEALAIAASSGATTGDPRQDLVRLIHGSSPSELGALAPAVTRLSAERDEVAMQITDRAVAGLLRTYAAVALPTSGTIVLAGSILTRPGPIREGVLAGINQPTHDATQPVVGALRLAAHRAGWQLPDLAALSRAIEATPHSSAAPTQSAPTLIVDAYRPEDRDALYEVCRLTGDSGEDASTKYQDGDLLGHVYLGAYLELEPELARVLRRADGKAVGYCVATSDTQGFEERCEQHWWPALRSRYTLPADDDDTADARMIRLIHAHNRTGGDLVTKFPAHLHIDLLPEAQGGGNGKRLLDAVLKAVAATGAPGIHLGVGGSNVRAIGFYEHTGFRTLKHLPWGLTMGKLLRRD
ncbi:GNAT family N-acetyltransferase [Tessaracoccus sp.]